MRELQVTEVEAAVFIADHLPVNTQLAGVKKHGTVCEPLEILFVLWSDSWKCDRAGKGEIKMANGTDEMKEAATAAFLGTLQF